jgi:hypothetical protein
MILEFAAGAHGNVAPMMHIAGSKTHLSRPESLHVAFRSGEIFVSNRTNSILTFAKGSSGNVAPAEIIEGSKTGLNHPGELELDNVGHTWIANTGGHNVLEYAPGASGNVGPINILTPAGVANFTPYGLGLDAHNNMAVSDQLANAIYEFSATANRGKATPLAVLRGSKTKLARPAQLGIPQELATPIPGT